MRGNKGNNYPDKRYRWNLDHSLRHSIIEATNSDWHSEKANFVKVNPNWKRHALYLLIRNDTRPRSLAASHFLCDAFTFNVSFDVRPQSARLLKMQNPLANRHTTRCLNTSSHHVPCSPTNCTGIAQTVSTFYLWLGAFREMPYLDFAKQ